MEGNAEGIRINKFLSEAGVCSRREADRLIESGRITVDGIRAETGMRVVPGKQEIRMEQTISDMLEYWRKLL